MSHFVVNVIIPAKIFAMGTQEVESFIEDQLSDFDESKETPAYVEYTKNELIENGRKEIKEFENSRYAEYKANPKKYAAECTNDRHIEYIKNEFPLKLTWSDNEVYEDQIKWREPENIGEEGEVYSTYNPKSKWDWYVIGGRWAGWLTNKEEELRTDNGFNFHTPREIDDNSCTAKQALEGNFIPFAIVTPEKEWIERGKMGWWAIVTDQQDDEKWEYEVKGIYQKFINDYIVSVDCHI